MSAISKSGLYKKMALITLLIPSFNEIVAFRASAFILDTFINFFGLPSGLTRYKYFSFKSLYKKKFSKVRSILTCDVCNEWNF